MPNHFIPFLTFTFTDMNGPKNVRMQKGIRTDVSHAHVRTHTHKLRRGNRK